MVNLGLPITSDGTIVQLGEVHDFNLNLPNCPQPVVVGRAVAELFFPGHDLSDDARELIESRPMQLDHSGAQKGLHIRSFLAQCGLHAKLLWLTRSRESEDLRAGVEFYYLVSGIADGQKIYPLHEILKNCRKETDVRVANIFFIPEETKPLTDGAIRDLVAQGVVAFGSRFDFADSQTVQLPLRPESVSIGAARAIARTSLAKQIEFLHRGKRFLDDYQDVERPGVPLVRPFDVRNFDLRAPPEFSFVLAEQTNRPGVVQIASPHLRSDSGSGNEARRAEFLSSGSTGVKAQQLRVRASVYAPQGTGRVSVGISSAPPTSPYGPQLMDEALISHLVGRRPNELHDLIARSTTGRMAGLLLDGRRAHVIPADSELPVSAWIRAYLANEGPCDEGALQNVSQIEQTAVTSHPVTATINQTLQATTSHFGKYAVILPQLPASTHLSQLIGHGVGTYILAKPPAALAYDSSRDIKVYHCAEPNRVFKLTGRIWVDLKSLELHSELEFVVGIYGNPAKKDLDTMRPMLNSLVRQLQHSRRYVALTTYSAVLAEELVKMTTLHPNVITVSFNSSGSTANAYPAGEISMERQAVYQDLRLVIDPKLDTTCEALNRLTKECLGGTHVPTPVVLIQPPGKDTSGVVQIAEAIGGSSELPAFGKQLIIVRNDTDKLFEEGTFLAQYLESPADALKQLRVPRKSIKRMNMRRRYRAEFGRRPR
jgi:hypothetical protein